jgi:hypothetical protein
MAFTIIGTYPIINKQLSSIDDNGIQTISYVFTVKTTNAFNYIPKKDDEYYGPGELTASSSTLFNPDLPPSSRSKYLVTNVNIDNLNGGLTQIVVNTAGSQNLVSPPKVRILPNYPLLFGLSGISITNSSSFLGGGNARSGYGIMATFITASTPQSEGVVFTNYSNKLMPANLLGTVMPTPARESFYKVENNPNDPNDPNGAGGSTGFISSYQGFICTETIFQRIGGVTLFQLIYKELGYYYSVSCPAGGGTCQTNQIYNFE